MKQKKILIGLGVALVVVLAGILILLLRKPSLSEVEQAELSSPKDPTMEHLGDEDGGIWAVNEDPGQALERYKLWAQYPPDSRPLFGWQVDLIEPYNIKDMPLPVMIAPPSDCNTDVSGELKCNTPAKLAAIHCEMNPESVVSVGTKEHRSFLFCMDEKENRLPIEDLTVKVFRVPLDQKIPTLPPIHIGDDGSGGDDKAGDHIYTITVRPGAADWGYMIVEAAYKVGGHQDQHATTWFSTPNVPAEFQQGITDHLSDGHLVVKVPVQVRRPGYYMIESNLQEKNNPNRFLATATFEGQLAAGRQIVTLRFWGKLLRDQKVDGPYIVRELRGRRDNAPVTPDMIARAFEMGLEIPSGEPKEPLYEYMQMAAPYETNDYDASSFSKEVWDSEDKQFRIKYFEELIAKDG